MDIFSWQKNLRDKGSAVLTLAQNLLKREYTPRGLAFLFIGALCIGAFVKTLVHDPLTMGYDDYQLSRDQNLLDLDRIQRDIIEQGGTLATSENTAPKGATCTNEGQ